MMRGKTSSLSLVKQFRIIKQVSEDAIFCQLRLQPLCPAIISFASQRNAPGDNVLDFYHEDGTGSGSKRSLSKRWLFGSERQSISARRLDQRFLASIG
jgi:hypothetical protein